MKKISDSKVVWFNVVVFIIGFLALPEFINVLPQTWLPYDVLGGAAGNLILRIFFTNQALTRFAARKEKMS